MTFRVVFDMETGERQEIPLTPQEIADLEAAVTSIDPVPNEISHRQFFRELANRELITREEALAAITSKTLPAEFEALVSAILDEDIEWQARMALCGATTFLRTNWFVDYFAAMKGFSSAYMDDVWRSANLIT